MLFRQRASQDLVGQSHISILLVKKSDVDVFWDPRYKHIRSSFFPLLIPSSPSSSFFLKKKKPVSTCMDGSSGNLLHHVFSLTHVLTFAKKYSSQVSLVTRWEDLMGNFSHAENQVWGVSGGERIYSKEELIQVYRQMWQIFKQIEPNNVIIIIKTKWYSNRYRCYGSRIALRYKRIE